MHETFKDKIILVTGGLGSIGMAIVDHLLPFHPKQIRVLDNRETEMFYATQKGYALGQVRFLFGDVRDRERVLRASKDADIIFHAAALKHVFSCENDPFEAVKTNVLGTQNVIEAAMQNDVKKVILISTDKAVNPSNVMGATKLLSERLISAIHYYRGKTKTEFGAVRFGNVLASRGSVLEIWEKQLSENKKLTITSPDMTRFFMTIPKSVSLIFQAAKFSSDGEIFIFKMRSTTIKNLAEAFLELHGKPSDSYETIGRKNGEKLHEELIFQEEADYLLENKDLLLRMPLIDNSHSLRKRFIEQGFSPCSKKTFLSSDKDVLLSKAEIKAMLKETLSSSSA